MKRITCMLGGVVVLAGITGCGGTSAVTKAPAAAAASSTFSVQFVSGSLTLTAGGDAQPFVVTATSQTGFQGPVNMTLSGLPSGVVATPDVLSVPVGSTGKFMLTAAANSTLGTAQISLKAASGTTQQTASASLAVVNAPVTTVALNTVAFDFGSDLVGSSLTQSAVQVTNTGGTTLTLNPALSGDSAFALVTGSAAGSSSCGQQLAAGANCSVLVSYTPTVASAPGLQAASLSLGMQGVAAGTQQSVALSGTSFAVPVGQVTPTHNPQVALYTVAMPYPGSVSISFGTDQTYGLTTWTRATSTPGSVSIFVAGMRASTLYHMRANLSFSNGVNVTDTDHTFTTGALPTSMVLHATTVTAPGMTPQPGVEMINPIGATPTGIVVTDLAGNTIWTYADPGNVKLNSITGVKVLPNGNFLFPVGPSSNIALSGGTVADAINELREVNLAGDTVREITVADLNDQLASATCSECRMKLDVFHHDVEPLPNGHWLVLASTQMYLSAATTPALTNTQPLLVVGDVIIDLDQDLHPVWAWNAFNHLDPNRHPYLFPDWTHANAVLYSKDDGNIIISMRHQNWVVKLNYADGTGDGGILWRLGQGGDMPLKGGVDPTDWFYAQHNPTFFSANTSGVFSLGLMDNGDDRQFAGGVSCGAAGQPPCTYTSIPVFQIDERAKTATLTFHQILPTSLYSFFGGSTEQTANGDVHYALCGLGKNAGIYEVTQESTPQTVWSMQVQGANVYRAERLPSLYPGVQW